MTTPLDAHRGDTNKYDLLVTKFNPATGVHDPQDLTGATLDFKVKRAYQDDDVNAVIAKSSGSGIVHEPDQPGAGKGKAKMTIPPAETIVLSRYGEDLVFTLKLKDALGDVSTIAEGPFTVEAVTQAAAL